VPEPAASSSGRPQAGSVPGRQPRALPVGSVPQSTPARTPLPALPCPHSPARSHVMQAEQRGELARAGSSSWLSPQAATLPPAPARLGAGLRPCHAAPARSSHAMRRELQAAASSSQSPALLPEPAQHSGSMGDPGGTPDPTLAAHLGSERVLGEEGVKLSQRQKSEDYRFAAGLSHLSPAQRRALSRAGLSAKSPPLH